MEMKRPEKKHQAKENKPTDRLIFTTKVFSESQNIRVGINRESAVIVNNICLQTGLTASEIVNRMIAFCEGKVEILPGFYYGDGTDEDEEKTE